MAQVFLPGGIRDRSEPDPIVIEAPRVHELLQILTARYPELTTLLPQLAVAVDGEIYTDADYVPLTDTSEVHLVPRIAGGNELTIAD